MTDDDDRDYPGPHTHVYVLDDGCEVCSICRQTIAMDDEVDDLDDRWDYSDSDAPLETQLPEYDFEGGVQ
jgi:hypothetical protein